MLKMLGKNIHQSWFVVALAVGVVIGVVLGLVFRVNFFASPIWLAGVGLALVVAYLRPKIVFTVVALVAGMVLAFFRVSSELKGQDYVRQLWGVEVIVGGVVEADPETDEGTTKFKLKDLRFGEEGVTSTGNLYVSVSKNEELAREDRVTLSGKLSEGFGTYAGYMYRPRILNWERPEPGDWVLNVRNWFAERIRGLVPEPEVSLGLSYLLGMKTGLSDELDENLRTVGLVHIVVASGAHLAILVEVARKIFGRISRFAGLMFATLFVVFFMAMVGWTPSILRAGMMTSLTLLAWYVGRKFEPWRIILIVAAMTLMINPMSIINLGWLLSFASYAGIMMLGPRLTRFFYGARKPGFVGSVVLTTVAATLMTLPIILYFYGQVSLIGVVANLLILPTLPYAMGLVFLTGVVAGIPGVEVVVGWCATRMLDFHIAVVEWFGGMGQFVVQIDKYHWEVFLIYLVISASFVVGLIRRKVVKLREVKC